MLNTQKITFIGGGNMATSIIGGLIKKGTNATNITVSDLNKPMLDTLQESMGVTTNTCNKEACENADVIVLAVKPQVLKAVCLELSAVINTTQLVISIAAGIDCSALNRWLNTSSIIRTMPNTPSLVGEGACGLFANASISDKQKNIAEGIMNAVGMTCWVENEELIEAVTAVSGSGPAYFFLFIEAMTKSGASLGLDTKTAQTLAIQTAFGAAKLAKESDVDIDELRRRVSSPNGTTEKAVASFIDNKLFETVDSAMQACANRAAELSIELGK